MTCTDYARHEQLLDCTHTGRGGIETQIWLADGCSGRVCHDCGTRYRRWPDVSEHTTGPADGLDMLVMLRAARKLGSSNEVQGVFQ